MTLVFRQQRTLRPLSNRYASELGTGTGARTIHRAERLVRPGSISQAKASLTNSFIMAEVLPSRNTSWPLISKRTELMCTTVAAAPKARSGNSAAG
jgi:hypothetical protein